MEPIIVKSKEGIEILNLLQTRKVDSQEELQNKKELYFPTKTKEFTTSCFIRKNTEFLRNKLKDLGYENLQIIPKNSADLYGSVLQINQFFSSGSYTIADDEPLFLNGTDCAMNEELFLALAALRNGSDDYQWFIYPEEDHWFICYGDDIEKEREYYAKGKPYAWFHKSHKANVEELIEHFK